MVATIFVLLFSSFGCVAQSQLRILPHIGKQSLLTFVSEKPAEPTFNNLTFVFTNAFGANVQWETKNGWQFYTGFSTTKVETGFKYDGTRNVSKLLRFRSFNFPFGIQKTISRHKVFPIKPTSILYGRNTDGRDKYLLLFRIRPVIGLSLDLWNDLPGEIRSNGYGSSAFTGITFQLFDRKRDRLSLTVLFSHGFRDVVTFPVVYTLHSREYQAALGSRGSFLSLQVGYPIGILRQGARRAD